MLWGLIVFIVACIDFSNYKSYGRVEPDPTHPVNRFLVNKKKD